MSAISYKAEILERLLEGETLSSSDLYYSNTNQYFCSIKNAGIELDEVIVPNVSRRGKHKERKLKRTPLNVARAKELLLKYSQKYNTSYSKDTTKSTQKGGLLW